MSLYIRAPRIKKEKSLGVYIHVPFCKSKCGYCDFYSAPGDRATMRLYLRALLRQMSVYSRQAAGYTAESLYIGGGTPTALPAGMLARIIREARRSFNFAPDAEISVEVNPDTASPHMLRTLRRAGAGRISMGMQSAVEAELEAIGRTHSPAGFDAAFAAARKAKLKSIGVDIMYGLPGQTAESFARTLGKVTELMPEHVSCYALTPEDGTPLGESIRAGTAVLPDEEAQRAMYMQAIDTLSRAGYKQYEISNFALPGHECRHNLRYWDCGEYIGLGPAAASCFYGKRFRWRADTAAFCAGYLAQGDWEAEDVFDLPPEEMVAEYVMLRLRLCAGIDPRAFERRFSRSFGELFGLKLQKYINLGLARESGGSYSLTPEGFFVSNTIIADLLDFDTISQE